VYATLNITSHPNTNSQITSVRVWVLGCRKRREGVGIPIGFSSPATVSDKSWPPGLGRQQRPSAVAQSSPEDDKGESRRGERDKRKQG
jgi:hypothetical protein